MTTVEILRVARAKVAQGWCQDALAIDGGGNPVAADDPTAVAWCAAGALLTLHLPYTMGESARIYLHRAVPFWWALFHQRCFGDYNEAPGRKQSHILALYDRAIRMAEAEATP
jgi:hypothetical protein